MGVTVIFKSGMVGRKAPVFCRKGISAAEIMASPSRISDG
jgi:hypothetical protein